MKNTMVVLASLVSVGASAQEAPVLKPVGALGELALQAAAAAAAPVPVAAPVQDRPAKLVCAGSERWGRGNERPLRLTLEMRPKSLGLHTATLVRGSESKELGDFFCTFSHRDARIFWCTGGRETGGDLWSVRLVRTDIGGSTDNIVVFGPNEVRSERDGGLKFSPEECKPGK